MRTDWKTLREAKRAENPDAYDAAYAEADASYRLGVLVRESRTAAGMTQTEQARRSGTSQPAIARLEAGGAEPTVATLRRMSYIPSWTTLNRSVLPLSCGIVADQALGPRAERPDPSCRVGTSSLDQFSMSAQD